MTLTFGVNKDNYEVHESKFGNRFTFWGNGKVKEAWEVDRKGRLNCMYYRYDELGNLLEERSYDRGKLMFVRLRA
ncbi:MAG: hypothetical protein LUC33_05600 [Prevotellaceae bacterium]|nr:hypothetical protein [Prevotellaceae bacterium]